jgi:hypothetical protein
VGTRSKSQLIKSASGQQERRCAEEDKIDLLRMPRIRISPRWQKRLVFAAFERGAQ